MPPTRSSRAILAAFAIPFALALAAPSARAQELIPVGGLGGTARAIAFAEGHVFAGGGTFFEVFEAADTTPYPLARVPLPEVPWDIDVVETLAYVALAESGLMILDVSDPHAPGIVGAFDTQGEANEVAVEGNVAWVADGSGGLLALDVTDPAAPFSIGVFETPGTARGVTIVGSTAYVALRSAGLQILDVSNPAAPVQLSISEAPDAQNTAILGTTAYVPSFLSGGELSIFDVADPAAPVLLGTYDAEGARAIAVVPTDAGRIAYMVDFYTGFHVLDVSDPAAIVPLGEFDPERGLVDLDVRGSIVRTVGLAGGFQTFDVSSPAAPAIVSRFEGPGLSTRVVGDATSTFLADTLVRNLDATTTPTAPVVVSSYEPPGDPIPSAPGEFGYISDLELEGGRLFVGYGQHIETLDWSDPTSPTHAGATWTTSGFIGSFDVEGDRILVGGFDSGLTVVEISDLWAPMTVATHAPGTGPVPAGFVGRVALRGGLAMFESMDFVTTPTFRLLDLADPAAPVALGAFEIPPLPRAIRFRGDLLFLACDGGELVTADISDPSTPLVLSTYRTGARLSDMSLDGDTAFLAGTLSGGLAGNVIALDVSDPSAPRFLASLWLPKAAYGIAANDGLVRVANELNGLTVIRFEDSPPSLANLSTRGFVGDGDAAMIAGFVVEGTEGSFTRRVLISGIGPDLARYGVTGTLANPSLALMRGQTMIASNDDWGSLADEEDTADLEDIVAAGLDPSDPLEAVIVANLPPGEYTAVLTGVGEATTGVGLVQAFDLGSHAPLQDEEGAAAGTPTTKTTRATDVVRLVNISTRAFVGSGDRVSIGGLTIRGSGPQRVLIRALGPTLGVAPFDVEGAMADPEIALYSAGEGEPVRLGENTDWTASPDASAIEATGLAPPDPLEPAILATLEPGAYTVVVSGANGAEGVALIEVYEAR